MTLIKMAMKRTNICFNCLRPCTTVMHTPAGEVSCCIPSCLDPGSALDQETARAAENERGAR